MSEFCGVRFGRALVVVVAALAVAAVVGVGGAAAADSLHGISVSKGCQPETKVGDLDVCSYTVQNLPTVDTGLDTLVVTGISDTAITGLGNVSSGPLLSSLQIVASGGATCTGPGIAGDGTQATPYLGATSCSLPTGSSIETVPSGWYTVQPTDYDANDPFLDDRVAVDWKDLCDGPAGLSGCSTRAQQNTAGASTKLVKRDSATATTIHSSAEAAVTAVEAGSVVHDLIVVTGDLGQAVPSGDVTLSFFTNGSCAAPAAVSTTETLGANGTVDATDFPQGPLAPGHYSFLAVYLGDGTYNGSPGECEPLTVVDANIQITPATATNPVGTNHTLQCHISVNDGNGFANAPDGTICTVAIVSGPGTPASQNCAVSGGLGTCDVVITSTQAGTSVIKASTDVTVAGVSLHRETGDSHLGDGSNAEKQWVGAKIEIEKTATNEVGQPHTFTATVFTDSGSGYVHVGAGEDCNIVLTAANGATPVPAGPLNTTTDANGQCSLAFTSATAGQVTGTASSTLVLGGQNVLVQTDATGDNSGPAVKTFVDAKIDITPQTKINPVGTTHTFTATVSVDNGSGAGWMPAPDGTQVTFTIDSGPGTPNPPTGCTTVAGSCTTTITSSTAGTTVVSAHTTLSVGGVSLTRHTDGSAANSGPAQKLWAGAVVTSEVHNAAHGDITGQTVTAGTVVHDKAFVAKAAGTPPTVPAPSGTVDYTLYDNGTCNGNVVGTTAGVAVGGESNTFTTAAGSYSYRAHYSGDANYPAADGPCEPFAVEQVITTCPAPPSAFQLGSAGNYTVLGLAGAKLVISEGATKIKGDVGLGANGTGSLLKATIDGKLFLDPSAKPDIHGDLKVTGGTVIKSMAQEQTDALAANAYLGSLVPTQPAIPAITKSTTINGVSGLNVINLAGVNLVKGTITINGPANALFVFNVSGGFNFSSSQMVLTGGVQPNNIVWNFIGPGADVNIFKDVTTAYGTFLAPYRNIIQDHAILTGRYIGATGGLSLKIHSAATVLCP